MKTIVIAGATLGLLLCAAPASAQSEGTPAQRAACTSDVFRLCSSDIPNVDAIRACLRRQKPSLSNLCRTVFDNLDKPKAVASRSIREKTGWCDFTTAGPDEDTWRKWCGGQAWSE